jgi:hypothetical protein
MNHSSALKKVLERTFFDRSERRLVSVYKKRSDHRVYKVVLDEIDTGPLSHFARPRTRVTHYATAKHVELDHLYKEATRLTKIGNAELAAANQILIEAASEKTRRQTLADLGLTEEDAKIMMKKQSQSKLAI